MTPLCGGGEGGGRKREKALYFKESSSSVLRERAPSNALCGAQRKGSKSYPGGKREGFFLHLREDGTPNDADRKERIRKYVEERERSF